MTSFASFPMADGSRGCIVSEAGDDGRLLLEKLRRASGMDESPGDRVMTRIRTLTEVKRDRLFPTSSRFQAILPSGETDEEMQIFLGDYRNFSSRVQGRVLKMVFFLTFLSKLFSREMFLLHGALAATASGCGVLLCGPSGVGKSTACRKLTGKMDMLAEDFILLSRADGKWFAQAAPTWSVWNFGKEESVVSNICRIVPLKYLVILGRGEPRFQELNRHDASLAVSTSFKDMIDWQSNSIFASADMRRKLYVNAFDGMLDMVEKLSCYRLFSKLDTDIGEFLLDLP